MGRCDKYLCREGVEKKGNWGKPFAVEIYDFYHSLNIVSTRKSTRLRWAGHVARAACFVCWDRHMTYQNSYVYSYEKGPVGKFKIPRVY
jgi:hypothetical protein